MSTPVGYNTYVGARYVPIFANPIAWDNTREYEPLTIVSYNGNSYTSKTFVPTGADISNETYWALTGNYNAQVESYRQEVVNLRNFINSDGWVDENKLADDSIDTEKIINGAVTAEKLSAELLQTIEADQYFITPEEFGAVGDGTTDDSVAFEDAINALSGENKILKLMPKKKYNVSRISVTSNTIIDLNGATLSIGSIYLFVRTNQYTAYNGEHDIIIKNGTIERVNSLAIGHNKNVLIENVHFINTTGNHFIEICASQNVVIRNCRFTGQQATTSYGEMVQIDVCEPSSFQHFLPQTAENPTYDHTPNDNVLIDSCIFERGDYNLNCAIGGHVSNGTYGGEKHTNITITNCEIYRAMGFVFTIPFVSHMTIKNNVVYGIDGEFITTRYTNDHIYISGNVVYEIGSRQCVNASDTENIAITGNTFSGRFALLTNCTTIAIGGNNYSGTLDEPRPMVVLRTCNDIRYMDCYSDIYVSYENISTETRRANRITISSKFTMFNKLTVTIGYTSAGTVERITFEDYNFTKIRAGRTLTGVSNLGNIFKAIFPTAEEDETALTFELQKGEGTEGYPVPRSIYVTCH